MKALVLLLIVVLNSSFYMNDTNHNVSIEITGIRSPSGKMRVGVYISAKRFEEKKDSRILTLDKKEIKNQKLNYSFYLEPGTYGLSLLDDENDNTKMDYNFIGMPKEGFGFSNYYHSGFTYPKFENFSFIIKPNEVKHISIKIRYI